MFFFGGGSPLCVGYQYGRVPWANTEVAVLVDEKGVLRFCLHELCTRVLTEHSKVDVFDMVKDLNLPMEQGDVSLLKKLQALGMHSNRCVCVCVCMCVCVCGVWMCGCGMEKQLLLTLHLMALMYGYSVVCL